MIPPGHTIRPIYVYGSARDHPLGLCITLCASSFGSSRSPGHGSPHSGRAPSPRDPTPPAFFHSRLLVEGVAEGSLGSVPVGIRVSMSTSESPDEGPHDIDQPGDVLIEFGIPKLKLKRTNDVSDLLVQIEDRGLGDVTPRWRAMPAGRSYQAGLSHPRFRDQCSGCCCSGGGNVM